MNIILLQASRKSIHLWDVLFGDPGRIPRSAFETIKTEVFIAGALLAVLCLGIAWLIANSIPYEAGKNPRDPFKRRMAFIIVGVVAIVLLFAMSSFSVTNLRGRQMEEFRQVMMYSIIINALIYFIVGFALSKLLPRSKFGTIFPSK
ncbi:MAG: hypothetical protein D6730_09005 [Bacteroidetes bacterium]|nr:MAG: hypothetical protein D6730_09005 [Bacteroidota bacterium]